VEETKKFRLGMVVLTRAVHDRVADDKEFAKFVTESLGRHTRGDWGDLCQEDKQMNDHAITDGSRILSAYRHKDETRIWIISECDRSVTTILYPDEY